MVPVIDRSACEGKADCVAVCPVNVFEVRTLPREQRSGLGVLGTLRGMAHGWQQAFLVSPGACEGCGHCVKACPEKALTLRRVP